MLKYLAILPFMFFVFSIQAHTQTGKTQQASESDKPSSSAPRVTPQQSNSPAFQKEAQKKGPYDVRVISTPEKDGYDYIVLVLNIALAVVGLAGIVVALLTLRKIERQTKATETASEAAAKSTAAFINKERSRLFVRAEITKDFQATFYAVNRGMSPARVIYGFVGCEIFGSKEKFREVPDYTAGDDAWVFSQNEWLIPQRETLIGDYDASYISDKNPDLYEQVIKGQDKVWFYGVVRYSDSISEDDHEIRFCYKTWVHEDGDHRLWVDGPEIYRRET